MAKNKSELFSGNLAVREQARSVFRLILKTGPVTRPMLLDRLALPATTLSRVLDRLTADSLISGNGQADSTGGRPANLFSVNANARLAMGIAAGEAQCHIVLMNLLGQIISQSEEVLAADPGSDEWLEALAGTAVAMADKASGGPSALIGAGLILPDTLASSIRLNLIERIGARLGCPAAMADDKNNLAAMNHARQAGTAPEAVLWIGETVRLVLPESVCRTDRVTDRPSIAGFLLPDPLTEDPDELMTLETLVTCPAIGQRFAAMRDQASLGYPDFLAAVQMGKKKATRLLEATAASLAHVLINIACVTGMRQFGLTGALVESVPAIVDMIREKASQMGAPTGALISVDRLESARWDQAAGAAAWMLSQMLDRPVHAKSARADSPAE